MIRWLVNDYSRSLEHRCRKFWPGFGRRWGERLKEKWMIVNAVIWNQDFKRNLLWVSISLLVFILKSIYHFEEFIRCPLEFCRSNILDTKKFERVFPKPAKDVTVLGSIYRNPSIDSFERWRRFGIGKMSDGEFYWSQISPVILIIIQSWLQGCRSVVLHAGHKQSVARPVKEQKNQQ